MLVVDFGSSSASHTYTSGFNIPGTASYVDEQLDPLAERRRQRDDRIDPAAGADDGAVKSFVVFQPAAK